MKRKNKLIIGIVGLGRFGTLLHQAIKDSIPHAEIIGFDKNLETVDINQISVCDIVFVCVPISKFEEAIVEIAGSLKEGSTVVDVCSVKAFPARVMMKLLPKNIHLVATHPMFGPQTFFGNKNKKIVVCRLRCIDSKFSDLLQIFEDLDLKVVTMTPSEHDKFAIKTQVFLHLIVRLANEIGINSTPINTKTFDKFLEIKANLSQDSEQLFVDMFKFNNQSSKFLDNFQKSFDKIKTKIEKERNV